MATKIYGTSWSDAFGADPIPHGTAAESYLMSSIDVMQQSAIWGSVPHWSANVYVNRSVDTYLPVIVPAWVNEGTPQIVACGKGTVRIGGGSGSLINVDGNDGDDTVDQAVLWKGGSTIGFSYAYSGGADTLVNWIQVECSANVYVFAIAILYGRDTFAL